MWFQQVCVVLTRKCNANCDICCLECSGKIEESVDIKKIINVITDLKEREAIRTVGITGGEPFLYFEELLNLLSEFKKMGMSVTFTSNGYWGSSYQNAFEKLDQLKKAGVTFFTLSVDDFHQKYVSYSAIRNIVEIAKKLNMKVIINTVSTKKSKRLKGVLELLQDSLMNCSLIELPCIPVGHAALRISEEDFIYREEIEEGRCESINFFTIMSNGDVYPCCSEAGMTPATCMGNIYQNSVEQLLKNFYNNTICCLLADKGPAHIYNTFLDSSDKAKLRNKFVNACDMCHLILEKEDIREKLKKRCNYER